MRIRPPSFWWRDMGLRARLLRPVAALYGMAAARRMRRPGTVAAIPVVCIGNPTLGGAGKTPTAIAMAQMLAGAGAAPAFLTRGYGGRAEGPLRVNATAHRAHDVGDEALLLARSFTTIVARDRVAGARAAQAAGAEIVVMDDGFHNPSLHKDFSALVVDAAYGVGNGLVFPAGPLRAPLAAQLAQAQALVVVGEGDASGLPAMAQERGLPCFRARLVPSSDDAAALLRKPVLAYAGIGHPEKFFATLRAAGADVRACRAFADHHVYSKHDANALLAEAERGGLSLVTTEKDYVRLSPDGATGKLRAQSAVLPVTLTFADPSAVLRAVLRAIRRDPATA